MIICVDWASVDEDGPPDWSSFKRACAAAGSTAGVAIMRGAYGVLPDPTVRRDWKAAQDAGLTTGAYLFLRRGYSAVSQVNAFADNVGALTANDLPPVIDLEDHWQSPEAERDALVQAFDEMVRVFGTMPMIYDSARVWSEDLPGVTPPDRVLEAPQWVAKPWPWPVRTEARLTPAPFASGKYDPIVPTAWGPGNWWMHQFQGDAIPMAGFTQTVDLSRFNLMVQGERGRRVEWVQRRLGMPVTGLFDIAMESRVRAFQSSKGLTADGVIGPKTFAVICWNSAAPSAR